MIQQNLMAAFANRQYGINVRKNEQSMQRLSSGYKINRASDNAAGLAISEKMRGQIRGLEQANRNIVDGVSVTQTADGAMQEISSIITRIRELAVQAANDTNGNDDRIAIQSEIDSLKSEIVRISNDTEFNGIKLLNNTWKKSGSTGKGFMDVIGTSNMTSNGRLSETLTLSTLLPSGETLNTTEPLLDYTKPLMGAMIDFGDFNKTPGFTAGDLNQLGFNSTCATCSTHYSVKFTDKNDSTYIRGTESGDTHYTVEIGLGSLTSSSTGDDLVGLVMGELKKLKDDKNPFVTHYTQYAGIGSTLYIYDNRPSQLGGIGNTDTFDATVYGETVPVEGERQPFHIQLGANKEQSLEMDLPYVTEKTLGLENLSVDNHANANDIIAKADEALKYLNIERGRMGAYQNRLEHAGSNAENAAENLTYSESRIRDADMAKEMLISSKIAILQQASQSVIAQANQQNKNSIEQLLKN